MLAYILAVLVGCGSVGLYIAAFFFPEIHRKHDFLWSGVGCFYALALWIYARQDTGGILIGQTASVALLGWFGWQLFNLRRQLGAVELQTAIQNATPIPNRSKSAIDPAKSKPDRPSVPTKPIATATKATATATNISPTRSSSIDKTVPAANSTQKATRPTETVTPTPTTTPTISTPSIAKTTTVESNLPSNPSQIPKPPAANNPIGQSNPDTSNPIDPTTPVEERAWIEIELRPAATTPQPLGSPVQPPASVPTRKPEPTPLPEIVTKPIAPKDLPVDSIPAAAKELESENWEQ